MAAVGLLNAVRFALHVSATAAKHRRRLPATGPETHLYVNAEVERVRKGGGGRGQRREAAAAAEASCKCGCQRAGKRQHID